MATTDNYNVERETQRATDVHFIKMLSTPVYFNSTVEIPSYLQFSDENRLSVIIYTVLFFIAMPGNIAVLVVMLRNKTNNVMRRRVRLFITHLCCADLFVSLIMMPMEIGWHISNSWLAGDVMCRVLMFFRTFGFYLSSFILMAMSVDRYFAVKYPLLLSESRAKRMIAAAWILSAIASAPQVCHLQSTSRVMRRNCCFIRSHSMSRINYMHDVLKNI